MWYQVQEMLRAERIFEAQGIEEEIATRRPGGATAPRATHARGRRPGVSPGPRPRSIRPATAPRPPRGCRGDARVPARTRMDSDRSRPAGTTARRGRSATGARPRTRVDRSAEACGRGRCRGPCRTRWARRRRPGARPRAAVRPPRRSVPGRPARRRLPCARRSRSRSVRSRTRRRGDRGGRGTPTHHRSRNPRRARTHRCVPPPRDGGRPPVAARSPSSAFPHTRFRMPACATSRWDLLVTARETDGERVAPAGRSLHAGRPPGRTRRSQTASASGSTNWLLYSSA